MKFLGVLGLSIAMMAISCKQDNPLYCEADSGCGPGLQCNVVTSECEPSLQQDASSGVPTVLCSEEGICSEPTTPICDNRDICRACDSNAECRALEPNAPLCDANGACVQCTEMSSCVSAMPICSEGVCAPCREDVECAASAASEPYCAVGGRCVGCTEHSQCSSNVCDRSVGICVEEANVLYVETEGNTANTCGGRQEPCSLITLALLQVTDNRRFIFVREGEYQGRLSIMKDVVIVGEQNARVIPSATSMQQPVIDVVGGVNVRLDTITIENVQTGAQSEGIACMGPDMGPDATVTLDRATVSGHTNGVHVQSGCHLQVYESTIEDNIGIGIEISESLLTLRRSEIKNNLGGGVSVTQSGFDIVNNYIVRNGNPRADGSEIGNAHILNVTAMELQRFVFNTVVDGFSKSDKFPNGVNCTLGGGSESTFSSNIVVGESVIVNEGCQFTFSNLFSNGLIGVTGMGNIEADPEFVDQSKNMFALSQTSPCIDTGEVLEPEQVGVDFDGDIRPAGRGFDMGANEYDPKGSSSN